MTYLSERIKAIAPGNAAFFRLKMQLHDGNVRIFPADEGGYFKINESPYGVPSGPYLLCFYDEDFRPLIHRNQTFVINAHQDAPRSGQQQQLALNFQGSGGSAASSSSAGSAPAGAPTAAAVTPAPAPITATQTDESAPLTESDLELRRHQYAMELEDRQQEFLKNCQGPPKLIAPSSPNVITPSAPPHRLVQAAPRAADESAQCDRPHLLAACTAGSAPRRLGRPSAPRCVR